MADPQPTRRVIFRGRKIDLALQRWRCATGRPPSARSSSIAGPSPWSRWSTTTTSAWSGTGATRSIGRCSRSRPARSTPASRPTRPPSGSCWRRPATTPDGSVAIREWYVSPGVMNERMYLYLCEDLRPGPVRPQLDEELETVVVPWEEALAMAEDGRIEDAKTLLALMICDRLRRRRRTGERWTDPRLRQARCLRPAASGPAPRRGPCSGGCGRPGQPGGHRRITLFL